ncbi:MAG TPA: NAD(P)H-dependent oxidoreductase subunit E, partial [Pseudomonadales bacterium]|nr:NAD(P)H-dependent oxidoreductase subunit E [Pseudomonadales bacterium]
MSPHTLNTTELEQAFNDGNWPLLSAFARGIYANKSSHLLQMLIVLQRALGCIPEPLQQQLARDLNLNRTQVTSVVDFYFFLCEKPLGRYQIFFSNNIIDKNHGADALSAWLCKRLQVNFNEPRADGLVFIGESACIGLSDQPPALLINGRSIARLDLARLEQIAALIEAQQPLEHWPNALFDITNTVHRKDWFFNSAFINGSSVKGVLSNNANDAWKTLEQSGLKGRGGAGFPTAQKWRLCAQSPAENRVVVCNADEGEPGTFKDRVLLTQEAHRVIEGMTLCAHLIGARQGFIYLRGEYFYLLAGLEKILADRRSNNLLGNAILGQHDFDFDIEIHLGAGAYICGEESALIESLEGKPGRPRIRPPFPVTRGYLDQPTTVNNVETLASACLIAVHGGA